MKHKSTKECYNTKSPFYYGWIIVAIAALTKFFSGPGQTYSISVFINSYIDTFGWSRSLVSSIYSIATLIAGLILPIVGRRIDRGGHRKTLVIISILLGITCLWMSFVSNPVMLFIGFVFLRLFGQGSMSLIPSTLVCQWFIKRRGFALSIMTLGGVISSAALPIINNYLINNTNMKFTWIVWTLALIGIMMPISWIFVHNRPEDLNLLPDGKIENDDSKPTVSTNNFKIKSEYNWTVKEAMRTRAFWLMLFCMFIPSMINTGLTFHMVSIIQDKGFSTTFAASILGITALIQLPLNFLSGFLVDKIKVHYIKAVNYLVLAMSMLVMAFSTSSNVLIMYSILSAIFGAFDSVSNEVLWPNYFGRKYLGSIRSMSMTATVIGSALGPMPFGYAYDIFGGYKEIILIMIIAPIFASIASLISPKPKEKRNN